MNIFRIVGVVAGLVLGFLYLLFAFVMLSWGWSDSGNHWSLLQWVPVLIFWSAPFLFTFWFVYRCFRTEEMEYQEVFLLEIRPQALKRALLSELAVLILGPMLIFLVIRRGMENELSSRVLLEPQTPFVEKRDEGHRPRLPLLNDAVGIETSGGKFSPSMFLVWPSPSWGFENLTFDIKAGPPRIKVYRGTNELAASNHFLGEFQVEGYSESKQPLSVMILFEVSENRQLFVRARAKNKANLELRRVDAAAGR